MTSRSSAGELDQIAVERIDPNPDNPRLNFRQGELDDLQESISQYGVQVPIAVYRRGARFVLIDGERRWRCASKLNLKTIPALIQEAPSNLDNLLLMFNIHALREQWDLLTIALKLPKVVSLLRKDLGRPPNEAELAYKTGLNRSIIRRSKLLMELPKEHQNDLLDELQKPKSKQLLSEDLYIELEKALKTVERALPDVIPDKNRARNALIRKYKTKVFDNIVELRKVGKIARAGSVGASLRSARSALTRLFTEESYSIEDAWEATVADAYADRDIASRVDQLAERLGELKASEVDQALRPKLTRLASIIRDLLLGGR